MELRLRSQCSFTYFLLLISVARCVAVSAGERLQIFGVGMPCTCFVLRCTYIAGHFLSILLAGQKAELIFNVTTVTIAVGSSSTIALSLS